MKMPFLSSILTYLGKDDNEPSQSQEESKEATESDVPSKSVVNQDKKVYSIDAFDSFHASKENDKGICNLASNEVTDTLENGKEAEGADIEKISNGCKSSCDSTCSNEVWTTVGLAEDVEGKESNGKTLLVDDNSDKNDSYSGKCQKSNDEVGNQSSDVKLEDPLFTSKEHAPRKPSSELTEIGSDLLCERSIMDIDYGSPLQIDGTVLRSESSENEASFQTAKELDSTIGSEYIDCSLVLESTASDFDGLMADHENPFDPHTLIAGESKKQFGHSHSVGDDAGSLLLSQVDSNRPANAADCENVSYAFKKEINSSSFSEIATEESQLTCIPSDKKIDHAIAFDIENANSSKQLETMDVDSSQDLPFMDESSNITNSSLNSVLTQNMFDEEEKYEIEDKAEAEKSRKKVMDNMKAAPEDERFNRLKNLLDRSNVYAQFLLKRMDQQREQEKTRREVKEKAKERRGTELSRQKEDNQVVPDVSVHVTRSGRQPARGSPVEPQKAVRKRKRKVLSEEFADEGLSEKKRKRGKKEDSPKEKIETHGGRLKNSEPAQRTFNGEAISDRQPLLVTGGMMRSYQIDGMEWMRGLFENGINGILADEMGLGKTLQCISLLAYFVERGMKGPFLIAAPLSTLPNWVSEFKRFTPKIKTLLYHGTKDERLAMRQKILKLRMVDEEKNIKAYPVVITSYEIIMRDRAFLNIFPWKYIIIDEGHRIKNLNCRLIQELKTYKTANRLLLTGTPLQNNLAELWSLLNFLLPDIFDDLNSFQEWFDFSAVSEDGGDEKLIAQEKEEHVLETLHAILTPFLLRRLKTDVDLTIPPKRELIVYAPLTAEQQEFYKGTLDRTILSKLKQKTDPEPVIEYTNSGRPKRRVMKNVDYKSMLNDDSKTFDFDRLLERMTEDQERQKSQKKPRTVEKASSVVSVKLQNILMQLRKCCNHPYLLEYPINPDTQEYIIDENLVRVCGKMKLLDQMLPELKKRGHKVLLFSQMTKMLDIIEDFCYLRHYSYSRIDGTMKVPERQEMIERFNSDPEVFLFLLSTRAGGLGLNLSSADTCIIYDSDWNPQVDLQAQDRCHRIGQTKPVLIFRFVTANSIDEKVVDRAASKRKLEKMVIHKGRFKGKEISSKLSTQDILELLKSKDHSHVSNISDDFVISKKALNRMLDRRALLSNSSPGRASVKTDLFKVVRQSQEDTLF